MPDQDAPPQPHVAAPAIGSQAWRSRTAVALFLLVAAGSTASDLVSKHLVFRSFLDDPTLPELIRANTLPGETDTRQVIATLQNRGELTRRVMPGVNLRVATNPGTAFGMQWLPGWATRVLTGLTIILVAGFFASSPRRAYETHAALGMIVGGAIGNLYDRLFSVVALPGEHLLPIRGQVRDFIDLSPIQVGGMSYPYVFNIADVMLVVGVGVLLVSWTIGGRRAKTAGKAGK